MSLYPKRHMRRSGTANYQVLTDPGELELMYRTMTLTRMAQQLGCTRGTVKRYLITAGIALRTRGQAHGGQRNDLARMTPRTRVQLSTWRLMIAACRCPFDCPDFDECDEECDSDTCALRHKLTQIGEMSPRPWESADWEYQFATRVSGNGKGGT